MDKGFLNVYQNVELLTYHCSHKKTCANSRNYGAQSFWVPTAKPFESFAKGTFKRMFMEKLMQRIDCPIFTMSDAEKLMHPTPKSSIRCEIQRLHRGGFLNRIRLVNVAPADTDPDWEIHEFPLDAEGKRGTISTVCHRCTKSFDDCDCCLGCHNRIIDCICKTEKCDMCGKDVALVERYFDGSFCERCKPHIEKDLKELEQRQNPKNEENDPMEEPTEFDEGMAKLVEPKVTYETNIDVKNLKDIVKVKTSRPVPNFKPTKEHLEKVAQKKIELKRLRDEMEKGEKPVIDDAIMNKIAKTVFKKNKK